MQQYNSLSDEELKKLLEIAKEAKEDNVIPIYNDVLAFLHHFNVQAGTFPIKKKLLFKLYRIWSKDPVSAHEFGNKISDHFDRTKGNTCININKRSLQLDNEVLKYLNTEKSINKRASPRYRKVFERFLKEFDIKEGNTWVEPYIIYHLYDKWNYERNYHKTLSRASFTAFLSLYFTHKRLNQSRMVYFKLNVESLNKHISSEKIKELRKTYNEKFNKKIIKESRNYTLEDPNKKPPSHRKAKEETKE